MWPFKPNYAKQISKLADAYDRDGLVALMGKMQIVDLLPVIESHGDNDLVQEIAADTMSVQGLGALPSLLPLVTHENKHIRYAAVRGLNSVVAIGFMDDLAKRFPDVAKSLAEMGIVGLGDKHLQLFSTIRGLLPGKEQVSVRAVMMGVLGQDLFDSAIEALKRASADSETHICKVAKGTLEVMLE